jgi:hypothetical protein
VHLPGVRNVLPDQLSRLYHDEVPDRIDEDIQISEILVEQLNNNEDPLLDHEGNPLDISIPSNEPSLPDTNELTTEQRAHVLVKYHRAGHFGANNMYKKLRSDGYNWVGMYNQCTELVKQCLECQRFNIGKHGFHPPKSVHALLPFDHIAIDLKQLPTSTRGANYILAVVDYATKFTFLRVLKTKYANEIAKHLYQLFCDIGFPKVLQSDNGTEFINDILKEITACSSIDHRTITAYHPEGNGLVERFVQSTSQTILNQLEGRLREWEDFVPATQFYLNNKVAHHHQSTPFSLLFAKAPNDPISPINDYIDNPKRLDLEYLKKRLDYMTRMVYPIIYNKGIHRKELDKHHFIRNRNIFESKEPFPAGCYVMILDTMRNDKTSSRYTGPFRVIRKNRGGAYIIEQHDGTQTTRPPSQLKRLGFLDNEFSKAAVVESILEHRKDTDGSDHYLVKWKDLPDTLNEWVAYQDFYDPAPILKYWKTKGLPIPNPHTSVPPKGSRVSKRKQKWGPSEKPPDENP